MSDLSDVIKALEDRIKDAEADERDHKDDPDVIRRELAGYTRGIKDALFTVHIWANKDVFIRLKAGGD